MKNLKTAQQLRKVADNRLQESAVSYCEYYTEKMLSAANRGLTKCSVKLDDRIENTEEFKQFVEWLECYGYKVKIHTYIHKTFLTTSW